VRDEIVIVEYIDIKGEIMKGRLACPCCGKADFTPELHRAVDRLELFLGSELIVTSGFRCSAHNAATPHAAKSSYHIRGMAVDCLVARPDKARFIDFARQSGFHGIGVGDQMIHIDVRLDPASWAYDSEGAVVSTMS
jgi:hypothetical protein